MATTKTCSFCGKREREVKWLVAGERACVCDECIRACKDILMTAAPEWKYGTPYPGTRRTWPGRRCVLCGTNEAAKLIESGLPSEAPPQSSHVHCLCDECVVQCIETLRTGDTSTDPG